MAVTMDFFCPLPKQLDAVITKNIGLAIPDISKKFQTVDYLTIAQLNIC